MVSWVDSGLVLLEPVKGSEPSAWLKTLGSLAASPGCLFHTVFKVLGNRFLFFLLFKVLVYKS